MDTYFPVQINNPEAMVDFGKLIATQLQPRDVLALVGNLGAGKTHLVQGIAKHFNYKEAVTSPSFSLIHEYTPTPLVHADLYRLNDPLELLSIGWEDYLDQNLILLVEWADRFPHLMPDHTHWVSIERQGKSRKLEYRKGC
jgi:tRNA threonylcarbamoyladenosine biosynthesis protein TsaE